jgi:hypothetical protein
MFVLTPVPLIGYKKGWRLTVFKDYGKKSENSGFMPPFLPIDNVTLLPVNVIGQNQIYAS